MLPPTISPKAVPIRSPDQPVNRNAATKPNPTMAINANTVHPHSRRSGRPVKCHQRRVGGGSTMR
jgi:hypothetical protein